MFCCFGYCCFAAVFIFIASFVHAAIDDDLDVGGLVVVLVVDDGKYVSVVVVTTALVGRCCCFCLLM